MTSRFGSKTANLRYINIEIFFYPDDDNLIHTILMIFDTKFCLSKILNNNYFVNKI